jgi:hypothetical protein
MTSICERSEPDTEAGISLQRPSPVLFTDEAAFCDWIAHAAPGASTVYFRGYLTCHRMPSQSPFREPERKRLVAVARRALQAAEDGTVHLVQRRHGPADYSYIVVKARYRRVGRIVPAAAMAGR